MICSDLDCLDVLAWIVIPIGTVRQTKTLDFFIANNTVFLRITIGNKSDERIKNQIDQVRIFLHEPGKFVYFVGLDEMPDNRKIDQLKLR